MISNCAVDILLGLRRGDVVKKAIVKSASRLAREPPKVEQSIATVIGHNCWLFVLRHCLTGLDNLEYRSSDD